MHAKDTNMYKIGLTRKSKANKRVKQLQTGSGHDIIIVYEYHSDFCNLLETLLHRFLRHKHKRGEWFILDQTDINNFKQTCDNIERNLKLMSNNNIYFQNKYL